MSIQEAFKQTYLNPPENVMFTVSYAVTSTKLNPADGPIVFTKANAYRTYKEALDAVWGTVLNEAVLIHFISRIDDVMEVGDKVNIRVDDIVKYDDDIQSIEYTTLAGLVGRLKICFNHME